MSSFVCSELYELIKCEETASWRERSMSLAHKVLSADESCRWTASRTAPLQRTATYLMIGCQINNPFYCSLSLPPVFHSSVWLTEIAWSSPPASSRVQTSNQVGAFLCVSFVSRQWWRLGEVSWRDATSREARRCNFKFLRNIKFRIRRCLRC